jgi:hypothetical protein
MNKHAPDPAAKDVLEKLKARAAGTAEADKGKEQAPAGPATSPETQGRA